jgi:thiol-disulfide isomerase/thioredoxin
MKRHTTVLALVSCLVLFLGMTAVALAAEAEPKVGQSVGNFKFPAPMSDDDAKYLGVSAGKEFTLKDVKAPFLLVEQFSTTCPHCMMQAPVLNDLFNRVQQDSDLKDKVKFLAMGQGNDATAIQMWKGFHKVPFPLFADSQSTFGKALNFTPYPVTVVADKTGKLVIVHIGAFESADEVMKELKTKLK